MWVDINGTQYPVGSQVTLPVTAGSTAIVPMTYYIKDASNVTTSSPTSITVQSTARYHT